jgi:hypothetical protein
MTAPLFLGPDAPVPIDRPFTRREAIAAGVSPAQLAAYLREGLLVSPLRGALHAAQLADGPELRLACARLVVPPEAVVTDRTAAWLHMAPMVLAPGDHLRVPDLDIFLPPGHRLRRPRVRSGERDLASGEVVELAGLRVTSQLRTLCDLGMQLPRRHAYAAMCSLLKVSAFTSADISRQAATRFKGYRWVTQLRALAPFLSPDFGSPGEAWLGLCWLDEVTLPPFVLQHEVAGPHGRCYLDLAVPELHYGAEYDGPEWHGPDRAEHDAERRGFLRKSGGWIIDVFTAEHVTGPRPVAGDLLRAGIAAARRRVGSWAWTGADRR